MTDRRRAQSGVTWSSTEISPRALFWIRVTGVVLLVAGLLVLRGALLVLLAGERAQATVVSVGGPLSPDDPFYAYSAVIEFAPAGQAAQRVERLLVGRPRVERLPFTPAWWSRVEAGQRIKVAYRPPDGVEILHPHARWTGALGMAATGAVLLAVSAIMAGSARPRVS
ncbi:MAG: DUF3592 domain-containing protein [Acidobacteria bacterium]|nr:DUF3592 domain-containing protein [Acidobacteriota bacterium]